MQLSLLADRGRIACVDMPALPLQLVLRAHPSWQPDPVVVVEDDRPTSPVLWANRAAMACKIHRGLAFGQAKTLAAKLRATVVAEEQITSAIDELFDLLLDFSPYVEPVMDLPGLFWVDPTGLGGLFGSYAVWSDRVHDRISQQCHLRAGVVVGFQRPLLFALSRARLGPAVFEDPQDERTAALDVPLARLSLPPKMLHDLALLDIHTVGRFLELPARSLRVRLGAEAAGLHAFLSGKSWTPLQPREQREPLSLTLEVNPPDDSHTRLLFGIKRLLHTAIERLGQCSEAITALSLSMHLERSGTRHEERLESAAPTLDVVQLADLIRLRLEGVALSEPIDQLDMTVEHTRVHPKQMMFQHALPRQPGSAPGAVTTPRNPGSVPSMVAGSRLPPANRALSRIRATFGNNAVTRPVLKEAHLPEAGFGYEPVSEVQLPRPIDPGGDLPLVRRVFVPTPLPPMPNHEPEAWLGHHGAVAHMFGPYRIAGAWWARRCERDYYFVETRKGEILWIYYDRPRHRWLLHGAVY